MQPHKNGKMLTLLNPTTSLAKLTDVTFAGLSNGDIMQYNSTTGKWENTQLYNDSPTNY